MTADRQPKAARPEPKAARPERKAARPEPKAGRPEPKAGVQRGAAPAAARQRGAAPAAGGRKGGRTGSGGRRDPFAGVQAGAHEWFSVEDPEELRTWMFDVTFLMSRWRCIFGQGCQGVLTGPTPELAQGCCSYGAHFTGDEDVARVEAAAATLTDEDWQFAAVGRRKGTVRTAADGSRTTRLVDEACIFLNRPGFAGGPGCALHRAALRGGRKPLSLKPDVCWQLPLRREDTTDDSGRVTSTITQWDRKHWGEGGEEFHWWCTEAPEAFSGSEAVYESMEPELRAMVGDVLYEDLGSYLDARRDSGALLAHPTVRRR